MRDDNWVSWEFYLLSIGEYSQHYSYSKMQLYENLKYFKDCWLERILISNAFDNFSKYLDEKIL